MKKTILVILLMCILLSVLASCAGTKVDNSTVGNVDMQRYLGKWYEIARLDHWFERGQTHCTANYSMNDDGTIKVVNRGVKDGEATVSEGKAKFTDTPGLLKVSFWGPFYSDYRIMMLSPDYRYALIGGKDAGYLWILSRTPSLTQFEIKALLAEAQRRGYDTKNLLWVSQDAEM